MRRIYKLRSAIFLRFSLAMGAVLLGGLSVLGCAAPSSEAIGTSWAFSSHRTVQELIPTPLSTNNIATSEFDFITPSPSSPSYSNDMRSLQSAGRVGLMRFVYPFSDKATVNQDGKIVSLSADAASRASRTRFEMAKAVVLVTENGAELIYNHDYSSNDELSNSASDINSAAFRSALLSEVPGQRVSGIRFLMRDDLASAKWRKNFSGELGSPLSSLDMYNGMLWTLFTNARSRQASFTQDNGAGEVIESALSAINATSRAATPQFLRAATSTSVFSKLEEWALPSALDLDLSFIAKLSLPEGTVREQLDPTIFAMRFSPSAAPFYKGELWDFLTTDGVSAVPYVHTRSAKMAREKQLTNLLRNFSTQQKAALQQSPFYVAGFFHYLLSTRDDFYWGGRYYLEASNEQELIIAANDYYPDRRYHAQVNSRGAKITIARFIYKFVASDTRISQLNAYRQGTNITGDYPLLSSAEQQVSNLGESAALGLKLQADYFATDSPYNDYTTLSLVPSLDRGFYFNDNFSRLLYGKSLAELSTATPAEYLPHLLTGNGLRFRKLLQASSNAFTFAQLYVRNNRYRKGERTNWNSIFSPDAAVGNSTLREAMSADDDFAKLISAKFVISDSVPNEWVPIYDAQYRASFVDDTSLKQFEFASELKQGAGFSLASLKASFKQLLDMTLPSSQTESGSVIWEMPYGLGAQYTTVDAQYIYSSWKAFLKTLDPRLNVVAAMRPAQPSQTPTILVDDWPLNTNFRVISQQYDQNNVFYHYEDRVPALNSNAGFGFASSNGGTYPSTWDSILSPIFNQYDNLSRGHLLVHSFIADSQNGSPVLSAPSTAPLGPFLNALKVSFNSYTDTITPLLGIFEPTEVIAVRAAMSKLKFESIWRASPREIAAQGLLALPGVNEIATSLIGSTNLPQILARVNLFLQNYFSTVARKVSEKYYDALDLGAKRALLVALQIVAPENYNPLTSTLKADGLNYRLEKAWFYRPSNSYNGQYANIANYRVDLDYKSGAFGLVPLWRGEDGKFRAVAEGGVVF